MDILIQVGEIFLLGAIGGSVPGPILTAVLTQVISGGFGASLRIIGKALLSEFIVAGSILFIFSSLSIPESYLQLFSLAGAALLLYMARGVWKIDRIGGEAGEIFTFGRIMMLTVLNSGFLIYWLTVCVPWAIELSKTVAYGQAIYLLAFEAGWLAATLLLAFIFSRFRPMLLKSGTVTPVFRFFALVLVFFALRTVYGSVAYFYGLV
jgi:threonine/homoserine/homoserine lactone efflux protein